MLEKLFGSRLRARVIGWLFTHPDERFFVRQLSKLLDEDSTNLSRELAKLEELDFLTSRLEGCQKYYQANTRSPMFEELKGLAVKTTGLADHLRKALKPLTTQIQIAFIHGSFARGEATAKSDADLILVGSLSSRDAAACLARADVKLGREISYVVYDSKEFKRKAKGGHHFITEVLKAPKIYLVGSEDALKEITAPAPLSNEN